MKTLFFLAVAMFSVVVCQAQPAITPPTPLTPRNLPPQFGLSPGSPQPMDTNAPVNYVIKVLMKDAKGEVSTMQVTTMAGSFDLDTLQKNTVKINDSEIPTTLKMSGGLTPFNEQKGTLKLFLGRTVPYVTSTSGGGSGMRTVSSYSQMSVGLNAAFVVTFGKPLVVQVDDSGEVTVLVTRVEN
jgi:hypothetical protein